MNEIIFAALSLFIAFAPPSVKCDCEILDGKNANFVGAFQEIGKQFYQLPETSKLTLKTDSFLYLICPGGFDLKNLPENQKHLIKVKCMSDGFTKYGSAETNSQFYDNGIEKEIRTNKKNRYGQFQTDGYGNYAYETTITTEKSKSYICDKTTFNIFQGNKNESRCDQASYGVGYQLGDKVIILLEFCYNALYKKLDFIHYLQTPKTHFISEAFNPVNASGAVPASLPVEEFFEKLPSLDSAKFVTKQKFTIDSLISYSIFKPYPKEYFPILTKMANIVWLKNLFEGESRQMFNELLEKRKDEVQYEVFMGTSGKISVPNTTSTTCSCTKETVDKEVNIPKFIWTYLKSQDELIEEEFVVINVNTPFADYNLWNETVFCKDMCNTIEWMKPMAKIRQMPYMGYIFCCNATEDVISFLDGFPGSE